ncbi:hypothetical protein NQ317_008992 [Molorchus minor]|uniref:Uncharacterized protein n=1 Tax=Molorchus minor TaxID=1323400 RepID=A0ABQ9JV65_9CUCU|nr:hypothetical protein NQ317_008992 [Molorchus minor]
MYPEAYKEWIGIFNDDLLKIWQNERKELQRAGMLLSALQQELRDVQTNLEVEMINLRQKLNYRDSLVEKQRSLSPKSKTGFSKLGEGSSDRNKPTTPPENIIISPEKESPDLFRNLDLNIQHSPVAQTVIDLSLSDDRDTDIESSPTIKRRKRHKGRLSPLVNSKNTPVNKSHPQKSVKINLFKTPMCKPNEDYSVIEGTPELTSQKSGTVNKLGRHISTKSGICKKNNTLTQIFSKSKKKSRTVDKQVDEDADSDETYFEDTTEKCKMGITELLGFINRDETGNDKGKASTSQGADAELTDLTNCDLEADSSQEVDEFSKAAIFNETDVNTSSEVPKLRGRASRTRANSERKGQTTTAWLFYGHMKLSPEELQRKMDECSQHSDKKFDIQSISYKY